MVSNDVPLLNGYGTAEARWARLGPYYAIFPIEFASAAVNAFSKPGDVVLDPFSGRGTVAFVSMISGREGVGCDINPVAWLYAAAKIDPHPSCNDVMVRIDEVARAVRERDQEPVNEFQSLAYGARPLGFINAARRELRWRECRLDRTVAAFLIHYLHAKLGHGLSNQLGAVTAFGPDYSVRWWRARGLVSPPDVDPASFLRSRAAWRYAKGVPARAGRARVSLGDAATALPHSSSPATLVLSSPPYGGVTNYRVDNWIRLWALGEGPSHPDWSRGQKFSDAAAYEAMLLSVFRATAAQSAETAAWCLRVDARPRTLTTVRRVMAALLPRHRRYERPTVSPRRTQTALRGDSRPKPGDVDLVYLPPERRKSAFLSDFALGRNSVAA